MTVQTFKPASPAQLKYVRSLSEDREVPIAGKDEGEAFVIARWEDCFSGKDVEMKEASQVIDWLKTLPRKAPVAVAVAVAPAAPAQPLTPGLYGAPNGDILKLQKTKDGKRLYAKVLVEKGTLNRLTLNGDVVHFEWVYAPGTGKFLTPAMRLPEAAIGDFGLRTGVCLICGRKLTEAESVKVGIGPVCRAKLA